MDFLWQPSSIQPQGDRQDQTVESTGQDDHALRAAEDRHNKRGESDETDDEPLVVLGDEG